MYNTVHRLHTASIGICVHHMTCIHCNTILFVQQKPFLLPTVFLYYLYVVPFSIFTTSKLALSAALSFIFPIYPPSVLSLSTVNLRTSPRALKLFCINAILQLYGSFWT